METEIDLTDYEFVEVQKKKRVQLNVLMHDEKRYILWRAICRKKGWNQSQLIRNCINDYINKVIRDEEA